MQKRHCHGVLKRGLPITGHVGAIDVETKHLEQFFIGESDAAVQTAPDMCDKGMQASSTHPEQIACGKRACEKNAEDANIIPYSAISACENG